MGWSPGPDMLRTLNKLRDFIKIMTALIINTTFYKYTSFRSLKYLLEGTRVTIQACTYVNTYIYA